MKKHESRKGRPAVPDTGPDLAGLINKVQQQLIVLERKLDALISQSSSKRPYEERQSQRPFQRFDSTNHQTEGRQDNAYRERVMHKAVCAECNKACEVPFKPSGDRPVYCKECFTARKNKGPFKENRPDRPHESAVAPVHHAEKHQFAGKPKTDKKKKTTVRKRK